MTYERPAHNPGSAAEHADAWAWRTEIQAAAFDIRVDYDPREAHLNPPRMEKITAAAANSAARRAIEVFQGLPPTLEG